MLSSKSLPAVLLATTGLALAAAATQIAVRHEAEAMLQRALAGHPDTRIGAVSVDLLGQTIELRRIATRVGSARIEIGTLRVPTTARWPSLVESALASPFDDAPATPAPAPQAPVPPAPAASPPPAPTPAAPPPQAATASATGKASADNITIVDGDETYRIRHIELGGTSLSDADLAALLDAKSAEPVAARLKKVTAASIVVPEITRDRVAGVDEVHWTTHDILLANVVAGRVETGSVGGTSIASKMAKGVFNGTVGAVQAKGLDLAQIVRVASTRRTDDAEPLVPLVDSLTVNGVHISDVADSSEISIGPIEETGLKGRPLKTPVDQAASTDPEAGKAAARDMFGSISLASLGAHDLKIDNTEKGKHQTITIAGLSLQDWTTGKLGGAKMSGFAFVEPDTTLSIGAFELTALDVPLTDPKQAAKDAPVPGVAQTDLRDVALDTKTAGSKPTDAPTHIKFTVHHAGLSAEATPAGAPRLGTVAIDQLVFDLPPDAAGGPLAQMGYARVDASGGLESRYDKSAQTATVKNLTVSGVEMGAIHVNLDLANVSPALFSQDTNASKVAALAVLLKSIDLTIENTGLVDRALAWRAKADNLTAQQEQTQIAEFAATQIPAALGNGAAGRTIGAAVAKFIAQPKKLQISVRSKTGLGIADAALISTPDVLLDTLDVTASANE